MIIHDNNIKFSSILDLNASNILFYLTGSHYFGTASKCSDTDFFTEDCQETRDFLKSLGFIELLTHGYEDELTNGVFRRRGVDVQLVKCAKTKVKAQKLLLDHLRFFQVCSKEKTRVMLWNLAFDAVSSVG